MVRGSRQSLDLDGLLARLPSLVTSEEVEECLRQGAALAASLAGSNTCFLLVGESERVQREVWHAVGTATSGEGRVACARAARTSLTRTPDTSGGDAAAAHLVVAAPPSGPYQILFCVENWKPSGSEASRVRERLAHLGTLLACKVHAQSEAARAQAQQAKYERWFARLDEQIQVLDRERQKFAAMVSQTDNLVFVTGLDRRIRWANPALSELATARDERSWIGESCRAVCRPWTGELPGRECEGCPVARAIEGGATSHREFHPITAEGPGTFYMSALPIHGPDGKPREIMVTIQDLSDLEALRKSESRYRALFERSADALLMVDPPTLEILFANAAAARLLGHPEKELAGLSLQTLHSAAEWEQVRASYETLLDGAGSEGFEVWLRALDGNERLARLRASRIDLEGRAVALVQARDLTESQRVKQALKEAEERLRVVVANSPVVLFALDADGVFTLSEGRGLESLGLKPGEVVGRSAFEMYRDVPQVVENLRRALSGEDFSDVVELGSLAFDSRYAPLRDEAGTVVGIIGVATDVSERRILEGRLRQSQKLEAVGRLAGGVAHDFNNLLTAILGACDLILREAGADGALRRHAEDIQSAGMRGAILTRQLLAFGRREVLTPRVLDANQIALHLLAMLHRLVGEDIDLVTRLSPEPAAVRADQGQMEQVLMNLVVNARDAMPNGGRLTIEVRRAELDEAYCRCHADASPGRHVLIAVSDEGCGMDAETQSRIFEPFFTTKERGQGTGLGLATVYGVARQWGGHVGVYSERGRGSVFKVYFPEAQAAIESAAAPPAVSKLAHGTETILLVEDEETVRAVTREFLALQGYTVLEAKDGVEALAVTAEHAGEIHLLLTDVVMPRMGGGELVTRLVAERPELRVLYMSGYPDDAVVRHGLLDEQAEFLAKPFTLPALGGRVREVLEGPPHRERSRHTSRAA